MRRVAWRLLRLVRIFASRGTGLRGHMAVPAQYVFNHALAILAAGAALRPPRLACAAARLTGVKVFVLPVVVCRPNNSFKRTAAMGCGTIMQRSAAAA